MCNILPKLTIGSSTDATADFTWGKTPPTSSTIDDVWIAIPVGNNHVLHVPPKLDFQSLMWELPKKKKRDYGRDTKHINKVLKKMGR